MAPPPEYDKEPKAPDKSATVISGDDSKPVHNLFSDSQINSDSKTANATATVEVENNKHVEHLDDGQLKALLDEAITYKRPKDREGKSSLFNELLEEVEQDEQALEAAARELSGGRAARRAPRGGRRALAHSNSLQDLEQEALAAECALRRVRHAAAPTSVSARAIHGGSLPCDVDKSFLLGEEASGRGGYLATVRCVNPPPLSERRVSASDAHDHEPGGARRSKPAFPMTYTARATLEIGSGSVGSGRAVTTTTASNQVRTPPPRRPRRPRRPRPPSPHWTPLTTGPPARLYTERLYYPYHEPNYYLYKKHKVFHSDSGKREENVDEQRLSQEISAPEKTMTLPTVNEKEVDSNQRKLMNAFKPKNNCGGGSKEANVEDVHSDNVVTKPRGPTKKKTQNKENGNQSPKKEIKAVDSNESSFWINKVNSWYEGLSTYSYEVQKSAETVTLPPNKDSQRDFCNLRNLPMQCESRCVKTNDNSFKSLPSVSNFNRVLSYEAENRFKRKVKKDEVKDATYINQKYPKFEQHTDDISVLNDQDNKDSTLTQSRLKYRERVGSLFAPRVTSVNPKNVRGMTISKIPAIELFPSKSETLKDKIDFYVFGANTAEGNYLLAKSNKVPSELENKHSNKDNDDDENACSNPQPIKKRDEESYIKNCKCSLKESGDPPAPKTTNDTIKNTSIDYAKSTDVSRCEYQSNENKIHSIQLNKSITCPNTENDAVIIELQEFPHLDTSKFHKSITCPITENDAVIIELQEFPHLDTSKFHKSITCPNTENDAVNIESPELPHLKLINKAKEIETLEIKSERNTEDMTVEDHKVFSESHDSSLNTEAKAPNIELKDCSDFRLPINEKHKTEMLEIESDKLLEINSERNTEDMTVEDRIVFSEVHNLCLNTEEAKALNIELKDCSDSRLSSTEKNKTDLLDTKYDISSQEITVQENTEAFNISYFEIIPITETESGKKVDVERELTDLTCTSVLHIDEEEGVELIEMKSSEQKSEASFFEYLNDQQKLMKVLEGNNGDVECIPDPSSLIIYHNISSYNEIAKGNEISDTLLLQPVQANDSLDDKDLKLQLVRKEDKEMGSAKNVHGVIPSNAYVFLTCPKSFPMPFNRLSLHEVESNLTPADNPTAKSKKKKKKAASGSSRSNKIILSREEFREKSASDYKNERHKENASSGRQVDSAIPFNCITSSEVVDTCNTTTSTQSSVAEEAKPRSVVSSSFNGLPLARTNYGSTATTTSSDEYKKSLDENGNSLQGFSSPQSGSSHNKKPRRKKSSKNETVITSHQIDGYKGDKDLNEVLRFIESHAEQGRHKLGRAKHKDDSDDKSCKKRSADRRKDKESKVKRASSLEELSRTTLEDLTDEPAEPQRRAAAPAKPERRSWGDDARDAFYFRDEPALADAPPDADFQTVTKKRKPRRRADEPEPEPPRPPRAPTPRARRVSAPPSDRSADSNDDMDSVHSLPADAPRHAPPAPAPVSYADIARTRHNIPDLIESCNFYAEGEAREAREAREVAAAEVRARGDADGYPALEPRHHSRRPRDAAAKPPAPAARSRDRKEAREVPRARVPEPDVVADRRPPVILLAAAARPPDMDGVTFGFDINEQLLGGSTLRPRCDLVRDAVESDTAMEDVTFEAELADPSAEKALAADAAAPATATAAVKPAVEAVEAAEAAEAGVAVAAGCGALRWLPPRAPRDAHQLLQIVDYVGAAWEDAVRCGGGKVRYFSE